MIRRLRQLLFEFELEEGERPPGGLGCVPLTVRVQRPTLNQVANQTVGMIGGLGPIPMHRLVGMVLRGCGLGQTRNLSYCEREIVQHPAADRGCLAGSRLGGQDQIRSPSIGGW